MNETLASQSRPAVRSPAEVYDEQFVPALFKQWGPVMCDAAGISPGQRVLDVACGTGALTLAVAERVGPGGSVAGLAMPTLRCWRWRAASKPQSNGTMAASSRCRSRTGDSMRW